MESVRFPLHKRRWQPSRQFMIALLARPALRIDSVVGAAVQRWTCKQELLLCRCCPLAHVAEAHLCMLVPWHCIWPFGDLQMASIQAKHCWPPKLSVLQQCLQWLSRGIPKAVELGASALLGACTAGACRAWPSEPGGMRPLLCGCACASSADLVQAGYYPCLDAPVFMSQFDLEMTYRMSVRRHFDPTVSHSTLHVTIPVSHPALQQACFVGTTSGQMHAWCMSTQRGLQRAPFSCALPRAWKQWC